MSGNSFRRIGSGLALVGGLLLLAGSGADCGSGSSCTPAFTGLSGTWEVTEDEQSEQQDCNRVRTYTREIIQDGSHGIIVTEHGSLEVQLCGDTFTIPAWSHPEGVGTTFVDWER